MNSQPLIQLTDTTHSQVFGGRDELIEVVYEELRRLAAGYLRQERSDHTLQPTALVHEAYLRLCEQRHFKWAGREHFIGMAAIMMRRVLINHAISRGRDKRGGGAIKLSLDEANRYVYDEDLDLIALDEALNRLENEYPKASRIVELKFFGGLSIEETATVMEVSESTVERGWRFARAWLLTDLKGKND
ncbi:MAG: sigma-70 family RNA polymerase sigma factor [Pyrinomonadaceae bacterium]